MTDKTASDYVAQSWWGRTYQEDNVYDAALARMHDVYDNFDHVCVSFSGGKDSTAVLNVALEVAHQRGELPLHVVFFDEEAISYQTERYVRRVAERDDVVLDWYCLPVLHRNACSEEDGMWWPWASEAKDLWVRPLPPEAITELDGFPLDPPEARPSLPTAAEKLLCPHEIYGDTAMVMGIRASESLDQAPSRLLQAGGQLADPGAPRLHEGVPGLRLVDRGHLDRAGRHGLGPQRLLRCDGDVRDLALRPAPGPALR